MADSSLTPKQAHWLTHVQAADASNGTLDEYASLHELSSSQLSGWKTRLIRLGLYVPARNGQFTEIVPTASISSSVGTAAQPSCRITLPSGTKIDFMGKLPPATVRSIFRFAESR